MEMFQKFCLKKIDHTPFFHDTESLTNPKYALALSKATGDGVKPKDFTHPDGSISVDKLEFHAIHNPRTDWTHYFALPKGGL